jgi:hypothetical protein
MIDMPTTKKPTCAAGKIEFNAVLLDWPIGAALLRDRALLEFVFDRPEGADEAWYRRARRKLYRLKEDAGLPIFYPTPRSITGQPLALHRWFTDIVARGNRPEKRKRHAAPMEESDIPIS